MTIPRRGALAATLILSVVYLVLGLTPRPPEALGEVPDVAQHALAYGVLAATTTAAAVSLGPGRALAAGFGYAVVHGALLEVLQSFTPTRRAELGDLVADGIGAALGIMLAWLLRRRG